MVFIPFKKNFSIRVPNITLQNPRGLSNSELAELKVELEKLAAERVGEVRIL